MIRRQVASCTNRLELLEHGEILSSGDCLTVSEGSVASGVSRVIVWFLVLPTQTLTSPR